MKHRQTYGYTHASLNIHVEKNPQRKRVTITNTKMDRGRDPTMDKHRRMHHALTWNPASDNDRQIQACRADTQL